MLFQWFSGLKIKKKNFVYLIFKVEGNKVFTFLFKALVLRYVHFLIL